ncbi:hypothetical protein DV515_00005982, partial [Chloebia gouldiae]
MDLRALALLAFALAIISLSEEKPVSLTYRCPCRFYESNVARANIKHLKILSTPNCSLQIVARLKSNSKQVCIDPKLKWIQEYLEKALNKECMWGQHQEGQVPGSLPTPHDCFDRSAETGGAEAPRPNPGSRLWT